MPLTRDFQETVRRRAVHDTEFRNGLLTEALQALIQGELVVAKILLRDYINATQGFKSVGLAVDKSPKSLMRMLSQDGNPNAENLFSLIGHLRTESGLIFSVSVESVKKNAAKKPTRPVRRFRLTKNKRNRLTKNA